MGAALYQMIGVPRSGFVLQTVVLVAALLGLLFPIAAGLVQTLRAAFGYVPALGGFQLTLTPWSDFLATPGLATAVILSLWTGIAATGLSLLLALGTVAVVLARVPQTRFARSLAPYLAAPHVAIAIGLAFVLSPSGWIARGIAPLVGWDRPPDLATVNDPMGLALIVGLMIKEVPFLILILLSATTQIALGQHMAAGRALGYGPGMVWIKVIFPQLWPLIRLPFLVVLAYSLSVVDMALILGPSNPPTLAVLLTRMFSDPDIGRILSASAGGLVQLGMVMLAFAGVWLVVRVLRRLGLWWLRRGGRGVAIDPVLKLLTFGTVALAVMGALAILALLVWSVAWRWSWPLILPESWSLRGWSNPSGGWARALGNTLVLSISATALCLVLAIAWLESEDRARRGRARWAEALIYLPLLVPQISFLFGMNVLLLNFGMSGNVMAVIWAHCLFVFPYVMLALSDPWRARDHRLDRTAASLGAGPWKRLFRVKLPSHLAPLCTAAAIGVSVSVAQYLPTLFMGAGRVPTLTTEAVALSSSSDRRVVGVYASLQAAVPFLAYLVAFAIPALMYRNRRDLTAQARP
jgi:putative thiamine transport system permease protein